MRRAVLALLLPIVASAQSPSDGEHTPEPQASATASAAPTAVVRATVLERDGMLRIPGGKFTMGSNDKSAPPNEKPPREREVGAFWIDKTEATVGAYAACVVAKVCERPRKHQACTFDLGDDDLPVSCVRWQDAATYCSFARKRLPREIEWEFAARGTQSAPYPWGNAPPSCFLAVTLAKESSGKTCIPRPARVGAHPAGASVFHALDMSGNVEEWVADWYAPSANAPASGASHVLRGGGWLSAPSASRATTRDWGSAMEAGPNVGFRCARDE